MTTHKKVWFSGLALLFIAIFGLSWFPSLHNPITPARVSAAAVDYFLKIDGIPGESTASGHENEIDLESWSWGVSNASTIGSATGGAGAGKIRHDPLVITKHVDKATPKIFLACANGQHIKSLVLTGRRSEQGDYLVYTFSNVICVSDKHSGTGGELAMEEVSFNYSKVQIDFKPRPPTGGVGGVNLSDTVTSAVEFQDTQSQ